MIGRRIDKTDREALPDLDIVPAVEYGIEKMVPLNEGKCRKIQLELDPETKVVNYPTKESASVRDEYDYWIGGLDELLKQEEADMFNSRESLLVKEIQTKVGDMDQNGKPELETKQKSEATYTVTKVEVVEALKADEDVPGGEVTRDGTVREGGPREASIIWIWKPGLGMEDSLADEREMDSGGICCQY